MAKEQTTCSKTLSAFFSGSGHRLPGLMQRCSLCLFLRAGTPSWPLCCVTPATYGQPGQLSSAPFSTGPLPVPCKVFSQLDKEQKKSQRGTSSSLHVLILSLASQAALLTLPYIRFAHGEGELSGTSPADFCGGDPAPRRIIAVMKPKTTNHYTERTPLLMSPQRRLSESVP